MIAAGTTAAIAIDAQDLRGRLLLRPPSFSVASFSLSAPER